MFYLQTMVYFIIYYVVFNIANHLNIIMRYILRFINIVNVACELSSLICKGSVKMWCGSNAKKYTRNNIIANGHQYRSSRPEMFCEKVFLKTSQNPQENACARAFLNTVAGLRPATLLKERLWHRCFSVNFVKILRTPFLTQHVRWLLLPVYQ